MSPLNGWQFHSDDIVFTNKVNDRPQQFSTGVDTAQMLMNELGYGDSVLNVPLNRSFKLIDANAPVCIVNKIKSEARIQKYLFSLPLNFFQTQRLFQLASLPPVEPSLLDSNGAIISLSRLLASYPRSAIVLPDDYSFGQKVDSELEKLNKEQIIPISNQSFYTRFMQLFLAEKADFALIFPYTINKYFGNDIPVEVRSYPIAGNPSYVTGHIICADTEQGKYAIATINKAIKNVYKGQDFIQAHLKYLPQEQHQKTLVELQTAVR